MPIHIYAEHLINIRTLTIQLTLPTDSNEETKPTLSADGGVLTLSHQGETASVTLPVRVPSDGNANLSIPSIPSRNLSFRVRIGDTGSSQHSQSGETVIPWTAASLSQRVELQCKNCCSVMVPRGKITTWKDLPSEGWAEMMEFWHCHKPNEPHNHEQQTDKKGYSAESVLAITPSVGLVNSTSFVLAAEDCDNISVGGQISFTSSLFGDSMFGHYKEPALSGRKATLYGSFGIPAAQEQTFAAWNLLQPLRKLWVLWRSNALRSCDLIVMSWSLWPWQRSMHRHKSTYLIRIPSVPSSRPPSMNVFANHVLAQVYQNVDGEDTSTNLNCGSCSTVIGALDATTRSYKMAKLALFVSSNANVQQSFDTTKWLSCHLLNSMDNQGLRRFTVTSDDRSQDPLMIWIFAPDLSIASSASQQDKPLRATKILWKPAPIQTQDVMLDKQSMTEGEIEMPSFELKVLKQSLEGSAILLPEGARRFQEWTVALLSRFTAKDVELL